MTHRREYVSSLLRPAAPSFDTHLRGPFLPATAALKTGRFNLLRSAPNKVTRPPDGLRPWRAARGTPIFRASSPHRAKNARRGPRLACADLPFAPPFPFRLSLLFKGGEPHLLHLPPLLAWARAKACL